MKEGFRFTRFRQGVSSDLQRWAHRPRFAGPMNRLKAMGNRVIGWWQTLGPEYKAGVLLGTSLVLLMIILAVAGEQNGIGASCERPHVNHALTQGELKTVLLNHQAWLASGEKSGEKANLYRADLRKANLRHTDPQAWLKSRGKPDDERVKQAWLGSRGKPGDEWVKICAAELQKEDLWYTNLQKANLYEADLRKADLRWADFRGADLRYAKLQNADLRCADLEGAFLFGANLEGARLWDANLQGACLDRANVHKADLGGVSLQGAVYEPIPDKLPDYWTLTHPRNRLDTLVFRYSPAALMALRGAFKNGGMRTQERQLTYAIERTKRLQAWDSSFERGFRYIAFELTSDYGMSYERPLLILAVSIVVFSFVYMSAVLNIRGPAGIWMVWLPERVHQEGGEAAPVRVTSTFWFSPPQSWAARRWRRGLRDGWSAPPTKSQSARRWRRGLRDGRNALLIGLYFSLLSAFSLGWRELNVGTWIARLQSREYILRPTGWVRTVAGIQSLLSVYLLALWVLTYFGRPFE
jgi:uncharacterized protein YjbI with pentapeptide repeats